MHVFSRSARESRLFSLFPARAVASLLELVQAAFRSAKTGLESEQRAESESECGKRAECDLDLSPQNPRANGTRLKHQEKKKEVKRRKCSFDEERDNEISQEPKV